MRVVVTRTPDDALPYMEHVRALGGEPVCFPLFTIEPVADTLPDLSGVRSLIFTSRYGVERFAALEPERRWPVFTVGPQTAQAARQAGFSDIYIAPEGYAYSMVDAITPDNAPLFYGRARDAAFPVAAALAEKGVEVRESILYAARRTALPPRWEGADIVLFFSARGARIFMEYVEKQGVSKELARTKALCLGAGMIESLSRVPWRAVEAAATPDRAGMLALLDKNMTSQDQDRE